MVRQGLVNFTNTKICEKLFGSTQVMSLVYTCGKTGVRKDRFKWRPCRIAMGPVAIKVENIRKFMAIFKPFLSFPRLLINHKEFKVEFITVFAFVCNIGPNTC